MGVISNSYATGNVTDTTGTTAQLQGALPTGFNPAIWATGSGHNPKLAAVAGQ